MLVFQSILVFWYFGKAPWVRSNSAMVAEPIYSLILADSVSAQLPFLLQVLQNRLPTNYMFNKIQYLLHVLRTICMFNKI